MEETDRNSGLTAIQPKSMRRDTHYGNSFWAFISAKAGREVHAFSNLEYYNLITLEMDPKVKNFIEQPIGFDTEKIVTAPDTGTGSKNPTPDVYVTYYDGHCEIQEVKYSFEAESDTEKGEKDRAQISREKAFAEALGMKFVLRTEKEILKDRCRMNNLLYMAGQVRSYGTKLNVPLRNAIAAFLKENAHVTIGELVEAGFLTKRTAMREISILYYNGAIDLAQCGRILDFDTEVKILGRD